MMSSLKPVDADQWPGPVHIKVLVNSQQCQLEKERKDVHGAFITLKGCLHLIFDAHDDALFNILKGESKFDRWYSLDVEARHLSDSKVRYFQLFCPLLATDDDEVKQKLTELPLFQQDYTDCWWIFHIKEWIFHIKELILHIKEKRCMEAYQPYNAWRLTCNDTNDHKNDNRRNGPQT